MSNTNENRTLRLVFPQWQGGNNPPYFFGAQLLNWLAPQTDGPVEHVDVDEPTNTPLQNEDGLVARNALLKQLRDARAKIEKHDPEKIVVIGGDCLVDLAPFAYLNEKYDGELAILWVDAHPDIMTPEQFEHAHAQVLGNLLGYGDAQFVEHVKAPIKAQNVCYLGVNDASDWEQGRMSELGLRNVSPKQLREEGSTPLIEWFKSTGAKHLAIHLDLDVLDPELFHSLLFSNVEYDPKMFDGVAKGKLSMREVIAALADVSNISDIVGIGVAEYLPWDSLALKTMLEKLPLIGKA
ncbi:arginase family protein [Vibrio viridaestus]|uniref:Arginase family protein n=1 Tax=Vibrio viridaestus TaxID=2487322 RepID=A0A3N9TK52_9VIBR|nr:arginase family protein [Vibrio viridaestus]RQW64709.1 arginase family protein [Vibrio viridaestus]